MFDINNFMHNNMSLEMHKQLAAEAAAAYIKSGENPNDFITKVAQERDMTPSQVHILTTQTNHLIHQYKYANEKDKYHAANFPLADSKEILKGLNKVASEVRTSDCFVDPIIEKPVHDLDGYFGVKTAEDNGVKTAELKAVLKAKEIQVQDLVKKANYDKIEQASKLDSSKMSFVKTARQHIIDESNSEKRMHVLGLLDHFSKTAGFQKIAKPLLFKLAYSLEKEGKLMPRDAKAALDYFSKEADCKAPAELISEKLIGTCRVVNGDHPLYISLKTIADDEAALWRLDSQNKLFQDKLKVISQKIRAL